MSKFSFDKDHGWNKLLTSFQVAEGRSAVFVGFLRSSGQYTPKNKRGKADNSPAITIAQIAAIHEFGSSDGRIPQRSFMRSSVDKNEKKIENLLTKLLNRVIDGDISENKALGIAGEFVKGLMKKVIMSGGLKKNAPSTANAKGSARPLIDTSQMINSIQWEVHEGSK